MFNSSWIAVKLGRSVPWDKISAFSFMGEIANQINYYPSVQSSDELHRLGHIIGYQYSIPCNGSKEIYSGPPGKPFKPLLTFFLGKNLFFPISVKNLF